MILMLLNYNIIRPFCSSLFWIRWLLNENWIGSKHLLLLSDGNWKQKWICWRRSQSRCWRCGRWWSQVPPSCASDRWSQLVWSFSQWRGPVTPRVTSSERPPPLSPPPPPPSWPLPRTQGPVTAALLVKVKDQPSWSAKQGKLVLGQTWILYRGEEKGKIILICEFWLIFISNES